MSSQRPVLYLQNVSAAHIVIFRTDVFGRNPVITEQHRISGAPAYLPSLEDAHYRLTAKGRKGVYCTTLEGNYCFGTYLVGIEEFKAGLFSAEVNLSDDNSGCSEHEITPMDFDERTGRIVLGLGEDTRSETVRIHITDLPPWCHRACTEAGEYIVRAGQMFTCEFFSFSPLRDPLMSFSLEVSLMSLLSSIDVIYTVCPSGNLQNGF